MRDWCAIYLLLVRFIYEPYTIKTGIGFPEHRLLPDVFAAALAPCGLFIFAWTARKDIHWIVPTIGIVLFSACMFIVSLPASILAHSYREDPA
jgi:DHA1 family multidrug resistance protein-like MFS transporter